MLAFSVLSCVDEEKEKISMKKWKNQKYHSQSCRYYQPEKEAYGDRTQVQ